MDISKASASRIKTNKQCEFKYFLEYHLRIPETRQGNIYTHKGSAVHEALEEWVNSIKKTGTGVDYENVIKEYYRKHKVWMLDDRSHEKGDPFPQMKRCELCPYLTKDSLCNILDIPNKSFDGCPKINFEDDVNLVKNSIKSPDYDTLHIIDGDFKKNIIGTEIEFDDKIEGVPVKAFLDLVIKEDDETIEVVDYKTGGKPMSYTQAYNDPQVRIYGKIAAQMFPKYKYIMVTLWFLRSRQVTVPINPKMNELTVKALQDNYNRIKNNDNPERNNTWLCNYCVGYDVCGKIKNKFCIDNKFVLPKVSCRHENDEEECWGYISIEDEELVTIDNIEKAKYTCKGHKEIHKNGKYTPKLSI